ncbi:MAG: PTS mannose/fructose/sorbose/N-acetylgalactosamine transporter subunit IIC [Omnitrophica WOR_2 bacterium]
MSILQAALIALFCYLGALTTPWILGTTGGWYVISRPLVAGFIVGLILGDVRTGVLIGIALQLPFIGLITPGGAVPADLSFAAYLGIPLAMVAKVTPEVAVSLGVGFAVIGVAVWQVLSVGNSFWAHVCDRYAEEGNLAGIIRVNYLAQIGTFILRFVVAFIVLYFGQGLANNLVSILQNNIPWFVTFLTVVGGALPAVGIAILLFQIAPAPRMLIWFLLGWVLVAYLKVPTVGVAVFGALIAVAYYLYFSRLEEAGA